MRPATGFDIGIWRLRQAGMTMSQIAKRAGVTKGVVSGIVRRIGEGVIVLPPPVPVSRDGCRWVEGDPQRPGWSWCDAPVVRDTAWCEHHLARVYNRVERRQAA